MKTQESVASTDVSNDLSTEAWQAINSVCSGCKWYPLIERFILEDNRPQKTEEIDALFKATIAEFDTYPYYSAMVCLNDRLRKGKVPFRIKKVKSGEHTYDGLLQICKIDLTSRYKERTKTTNT